MHEKRWRGSTSLKPCKFMEVGVPRHKRSKRYNSVCYFTLFSLTFFLGSSFVGSFASSPIGVFKTREDGTILNKSKR